MGVEGRQPAHPSNPYPIPLSFLLLRVLSFLPSSLYTILLTTYGTRAQNDLALCFLPGRYQLLLAYLLPVHIIALS
jgi:hypothetical protein